MERKCDVIRHATSIQQVYPISGVNGKQDGGVWAKEVANV